MENQEIEELKSTVIRLENELTAKNKRLNLYEIYLIITLLLIILNLFLVIYFFKQRPTGRPILQAYEGTAPILRGVKYFRHQN